MKREFGESEPGAMPVFRSAVVIVGAGIAGAWLGLKLARAGLDTVIVHYSGKDRGGTLGSSTKAVGAINTGPIDMQNFRAFMEETGQWQNHPSVVDLLVEHLDEELEDLRTFAEFKKVQLGVALVDADTAGLLQRLYSAFTSYGGRMLDAWVTRVVADESGCKGVQYQQGNHVGKILSPAVVIAGGGYAALFDGSVKTNNYGAMLGRFLHAGGLATNLEFVFKHGYGKPDSAALTPTEELPGAEIYDDGGTHVSWLERELYEGRGTQNHLQAFKHWRRNQGKDFYIDLRFQPLFRKIQSLNAAMATAHFDKVQTALQALHELCPPGMQAEAMERLQCWVSAGETVDFERFCQLKPYFRETAHGETFRVRQIAYFSMGGIAHVRCETNLRNVFVTGEAMHDFGAHRVGGLPWGLYLATGRSIADRLLELNRRGDLAQHSDFELINAHSRFNGELLQAIRAALHQYQEKDLNVQDANRLIEWIRTTRRDLLERGDVLDDGVAWLIVAEGIMQASLLRVESRGCFYRSDYPDAAEDMDSVFTCVSYDEDADSVSARLVRASELHHLIPGSGVQVPHQSELGVAI